MASSTSSAPTRLILHHYGASPFAEKVRLALALKGIPYTQVLVPPVVAGREQTMELAGGYRRIPVLQLGADIYCDTALILREIERRFPTPSLVPRDKATGQSSEGAAWMLARWTDSEFFQMTAALIPWELMPENFAKDRADYTGTTVNVEGMKAMRPHFHRQFYANLSLLEAQLAPPRQWVLGTDAPSHADVHAAMNVWFLKSLRNELDDKQFPNVARWFAQLYKTAGKVTVTNMTQGDATEVARRGPKAPVPASAVPGNKGLSVGDVVSVTPTDTGKRPVSGRLLFLSATEVVIARAHSGGFETHIHFPVVGYSITPMKQKL